jgi:hypothetical protein
MERIPEVKFEVVGWLDFLTVGNESSCGGKTGLLIEYGQGAGVIPWAEAERLRDLLTTRLEEHKEPKP